MYVKSFICIPNPCMLEAKRAAAPLWKAARLWSAISLLCFNMGFQLFHSISPLSFFRALFLSYLAFSSLSPNNLFYLLSPTITPFLIIVSILFLFFFLLDGGPGAPALHWGVPLPAAALGRHVGAGAPSPLRRIGVCTTAEEACHTLRWAFYICFAGAYVIYQSAEQRWIRSLMQIRSSHMAWSIWEHFRLKRKKKKQKKKKMQLWRIQILAPRGNLHIVSIIAIYLFVQG